MTAIATAPPATAAAPIPTSQVPLLDDADRLLVKRFSYGVTPDLAAEVNNLGAATWFERQLQPENIADGFAANLVNWFPKFERSPAQLWAGRGDGFMDLDYCYDFQNWTLLRRIYSKRQVHEAMTEFWSNHLHVDVPANKTWTWRYDYDRTIRQHALGRFDEMLEAAILHPSMLCYLDQALSSRRSINENLGRELLELHTVGRGAGYTEDQVRNSAYILTGWNVDLWNTWKLSYQPDDHWVGAVRVMDFSATNSSPDGQQLSRSYLRYLAHHPETAKRIARKLAVRFVSDAPSQQLVDDLAGVFSASGTDIKATLRALIRHPEFAGSRGSKVRTPTEDLAATYRALQVEVLAPSGKSSDAAVTLRWLTSAMGQTPFNWTSPDGFPDTGDAWVSTARMLGSFSIHWATAGGWRPDTGVRFQSSQYFFPPLPARFDACVDHAHRLMFARPVPPRVLTAVCQAVGLNPGDSITGGHAVTSSRFGRVLTTLLDSRELLKR